MSWSRETNWRQGSIIWSQNLETVGHPIKGSFALAISHDCDIANDDLDAEPVVEFVCGRIVDSVNGNYTFGKNPRILHVRCSYKDKPAALEVLAVTKFAIDKTLLSRFEPDPDVMIEPKDIDILQGWLASRYKRQALPNALVERLRPLFSFITEHGKKPKNSSDIIGYWFNYEPYGEELQNEEPYELWLYVVYAIDGQSGAAQASATTAKINKDFSKLKNGCVDLRECTAYSEQEFTLHDLRTNINYVLEHLSYRSEPYGAKI